MPSRSSSDSRMASALRASSSPFAVIAERAGDATDVVEHRGAAAAIAHALELVEASLKIVERGGVVADSPVRCADVVQRDGHPA